MIGIGFRPVLSSNPKAVRFSGNTGNTSDLVGEYVDKQELLRRMDEKIGSLERQRETIQTFIDTQKANRARLEEEIKGIERQINQ